MLDCELARDLGNRIVAEIFKWGKAHELGWSKIREISRIVLLGALVTQPAQQETGSRSKRHPESVEGEGSRGGGT